MTPRDPEPARRLTRRGFLGGAAAAAAAVAAGPACGAATAPPGGAGVLVDLTRCIGCRACEQACRTKQGQPPLLPARTGWAGGADRLAWAAWTFVEPVATGAGTVPVKRQCMHCLDPACVSVCPVAALVRSPRGAVVYRADRCMGCRYCMIACPFEVPAYEWDNALDPKVGKCDFCDDRLAAGLKPACVVACPTGALKFGARDRLLDEARARMAGQPRRYATLVGETEAGGTGWLYLSDLPAAALGYPPEFPRSSLPALTWRALSKIPAVVAVMGTILAGLWLARGRRAPHA